MASNELKALVSTEALRKFFFTKSFQEALSEKKLRKAFVTLKRCFWCIEHRFVTIFALNRVRLKMFRETQGNLER